MYCNVEVWFCMVSYWHYNCMRCIYRTKYNMRPRVEMHNPPLILNYFFQFTFYVSNLNVSLCLVSICSKCSVGVEWTWSYRTSPSLCKLIFCSCATLDVESWTNMTKQESACFLCNCVLTRLPGTHSWCFLHRASLGSFPRTGALPLGWRSQSPGGVASLGSPCLCTHMRWAQSGASCQSQCVA